MSLKSKLRPARAAHDATITVPKDLSLVVRYQTEDIRKREVKEAYARDVDDVFMFIKQQWASDVSVENYWWLSKKYILVLTKTDMTLLTKTADGGLDDWMGDKWSTMWSAPRSLFIGTEDLQYGVANAKDLGEDVPVFYTIGADDTHLVIKTTVNVLTKPSVEDKSRWHVCRVRLRQQAIDDKNPDFKQSSEIRSFQALAPYALASAAKISATTVKDGYTIFGIAYDRGLNQWTVPVKGGTAHKVVTGYGYVGLDAGLTGGQLPANCCNETGFFGTVHSIGWLRDFEEQNVLPNCAVTTGTTFWFLFASVPRIVSHFTYKGNGAFKPVYLFLNNNVSWLYHDYSFLTRQLGDTLPKSLNIKDFFQDLLVFIQQFLNVITPTIYYTNAKYLVFAYIQHTIGQYAYVYKNSTQETNDLNVTDKDITFCTRKKEIVLKDSDKCTLPQLNIILKGVDFLTQFVPSYTVNRSDNSTMTDDRVGRRLTTFVRNIVDGTANTSIISNGFNVSMRSKLMLQYRLNMFYSISAKSQCWAGPGFVNHNFVGECIAESASDKQVEAKRVGHFASYASVARAVQELKLFTLQMTYDALISAADAVSALTVGVFGMGSGTLVPVGQIISAAMRVSAAVMVPIIALNKAGLSVIDNIGAAIGGEPGETYDNGKITEHNVMIEGTHTYGQKPMSFFYPAFGITEPVEYTNESVLAENVEDGQELAIKPGSKDIQILQNWNPSHSNKNTPFIENNCDGTLWSSIAKCRGVSRIEKAPVDTAVVEGVTAFLSTTPFKNEQIGVSDPVFPPPAIFDYKINGQWNLGFTASGGNVVSVSCDDTKILDGAPSNIVVDGFTFCGVASPYIAMEIKRGYDERYLRPYAITPQTIALNINRVNCVHDGRAYHAFDGYSNRIVNWRGTTGMDKATLYQQYLFQINDHFKRSNIFPPSQYLGAFDGPPSVAMRTYDKVANLIQASTQEQGFENDTPGEQKNLQRFSIPVFSEAVSTLPAMVRMLAPYKLHVVEGVTSLCTDIRSTQGAYKAPTSVDFNINGTPYRATSEYISAFDQKMGMNGITNVVATEGLTFVGATTKEAFFYSPATRMYYSFTGEADITVLDVANRFKDMKDGRWDFVNQEVVFHTLINDAISVVRLNKMMLGEIYPPNETVRGQDDKFLLLSMPGGFTFQGPNRFAVNRFLTLPYMYRDINNNKKKWKRLSREDYWQEREYPWKYKSIDGELPKGFIIPDGWTHNPFRLVTAFLGIDEHTDCKYEWHITFSWSEEMDALYKDNEYVTVNLMAESASQGGRVTQRPTHVFLCKKYFGRDGYYTFRFQSEGGACNRERLFVWCDGYINVSGLAIAAKTITANRTQALHVQTDVQALKEM